MIHDIKTGWFHTDKEALVIFPATVLLIGALPPVMQLFGAYSPLREIIIAAFAAIVTVIELLRLGGRLRDASTYD